MGDATEKLLLVLGGAALGSLAVLGLSKGNTENLRPALAEMAAGSLNLRDKALGAVQRVRENASDFMAEVEYARAVKSGEQIETVEPAPEEQVEAAKGKG